MSRRQAGWEDEEPAVDAGPMALIGLTFGTFPEVTALNKRFVPGQRRLKLTLDVHLGAGTAHASPSSLIEGLERICPSLSRHVCCGDNRIQETFFDAGRRPSCAMREVDDTVDTAHLLEHLIIDFQHGIADMRVCSGVTCGYRAPEHRYDLFVESPDERVSRLGVALAMDLMNGLLRGVPADPLYAKIVRLARHVYRGPDRTVTPRSTSSALEGDRQSLSALLSLAELGFLREIEASMNFSGMPIFSVGDIGP
ncbi:MAG TPA: hypothetical protein VGK94_06855 [Candidatus Polarisedimenticolia bacterium]|jgi:hypothetical protein